MAHPSNNVQRIEGEDPDLAPLEAPQSLRRRSSDLSRVGSPMLGGLSYGSARSSSLGRVGFAISCSHHIWKKWCSKLNM